MQIDLRSIYCKKHAYIGKRNHNYGKHLSKEIRKKIGKGNEGKLISEESRRKMSESHKGKNHPNWKNGITLCKKCHDEIKCHEKEWVNIFRQIVDNKGDQKVSEEKLEKEQSIVPISQSDDIEVKILVSYIDPELADNIKLNDVEIKLLSRYSKHYMAGSLSACPLHCLGKKCVYKSCPLSEMKKAPIGKQCPFEVMAMQKWATEYIKSSGLDWNNKVDRTLVMDLVEVDIMNARSNEFIATEDNPFTVRNCIGVNESSGEPLYKTEKNIIYDIKDSLHKRKDKILKALAATQEMKLKYKDMKAIKDVSQYAAELRKKAENIELQQHKDIILKEKIIIVEDAEFNDKKN